MLIKKGGCITPHIHWTTNLHKYIFPAVQVGIFFFNLRKELGAFSEFPDPLHDRNSNT